MEDIPSLKTFLQKTYPPAKRKKRKFTDEVVRQMRLDFEMGKTYKQISIELGTHLSNVWRAINRLSYNDIK